MASSDLSDCWPLVRSGLTPAAVDHVPFAGRRNPISERRVVLSSDWSPPEQAVSDRVTIVQCDGTSAAESPKAIQHLCSFAGQLGPQRVRLHVPPAFLRVDAGRTVFVFGPPPTRRLSGVTFASVVMILAAVVVLACLEPARRAARLDPMEALRYE